MTKTTLSGSNGIRGEITVPGDKSITHRSVIFGAIANGTTRVKGFLAGEDNLRTIDAFRQMGVKIDIDGDELTIHGVGLNGLTAPKNIIYAGNSGTTARLLIGLLSGQRFSSTIDGDQYLRKRPMGRVLHPLVVNFGAQFADYDSKKKQLPITILPGEIRSATYTMSIASAQLKSALLLAAMYADGKTVIEEAGPARDHTERMLKAMGADIIDHASLEDLNKAGANFSQTYRGNENYIIFKGGQELNAIDIEVPGDISSAAFFIVAAAIVPNSELLIKNVGVNPTRTGILDVLKDMGADITLESERTVSGEPVADILVKSSDLKGIEIGGETIPKAIDEFPIIALAAAMAEGVTRVRDAHELRYKESDRIITTATNLRMLGVEVNEYPSGMDIHGGSSLKGSADLKSYGDHRIAMMLSIAALIADADCTIDDTDCVQTSFPNFFTLLKSISR